MAVFMKKFLGWLFTAPSYRELTETQSEGVIAALVVALHADGEPTSSEQRAFSSELAKLSLYWADESRVEALTARYAERMRQGSPREAAAKIAADISPLLAGVELDFVLLGAVFVARGGESLLPIEHDTLQVLGEALGVPAEMIRELLSDPQHYLRREYGQDEGWAPPWDE